MDYLDQVELTKHDSWAKFSEYNAASGAAARIVLLTTRADLVYTDFNFQPADILLLGRESAGVPDNVHASVDASIVVPMSPEMRSLNIAVSAAMVLGEALRQTDGFPD